jgi:hypothetical protein
VVVSEALRFGCLTAAVLKVAVSFVPGAVPPQLAPVLKSVPVLLQVRAAASADCAMTPRNAMQRHVRRIVGSRAFSATMPERRNASFGRAKTRATPADVNATPHQLRNPRITMAALIANAVP